MGDEFEVIQHPQINGLNIFMVNVEYRTPHLHKDLEINLILSGKAAFICRGNIACEVTTGQMVLLNCNQPHEIKSNGQPATILSVQASPKLFKYVCPGFEDIYFDTITPFDFISEEEKKEILKIMLRLSSEYVKKQKYYEIYCLSKLSLLIYRLLNWVPQHEISSEERQAIQKRVERLNKIIQYVDDRYAHNARLSDIAKSENLSLSYLSHFVKDNLNQTFQEYVAMVRFNQARKLILTTNKNLLTVSIESGFSDARYMIKAFLNNTGMTPEEYRNRFSGAHIPNIHHSLHSSQQFFPSDKLLEELQKFKVENDL